MTDARLRPKAQVTIPADIIAALGITEGDVIEFEPRDDGTVTMTGFKRIRARQARATGETEEGRDR